MVGTATGHGGRGNERVRSGQVRVGLQPPSFSTKQAPAFRTGHACMHLGAFCCRRPSPGCMLDASTAAAGRHTYMHTQGQQRPKGRRHPAPSAAHLGIGDTGAHAVAASHDAGAATARALPRVLLHQEGRQAGRQRVEGGQNREGQGGSKGRAACCAQAGVQLPNAAQPT